MSYELQAINYTPSYTPTGIIASIHNDETAYKKCINCAKYYTINSPTACKFHSGKYSELHNGMINSSKWTCCKMLLAEVDGCCLGSHMEDYATTSVLNKFSGAIDHNNKVNKIMEQVKKDNDKEKASDEPNILVLPAGYEVKPESSSLNSKKTKGDETPTGDLLPELTEPPKEPKETYYYNGHVFHKVTGQDTLQGLVLKYEARVDQLKKDNQIFGDNIWGKKWLKIKVDKQPPAIVSYLNTPTEGITARAFMKALGCSMEEAKYYISETDGDFKASVELYYSDIEWEKKGRQEHKHKLNKKL